MAYIRADGVIRDLPWLYKNAISVTNLFFGGTDLDELQPIELSSLTNVYFGGPWRHCGLKRLPELPAAKYIRLMNCEFLTELPEMPMAKDIRINACPNLILQTSTTGRNGHRFFLVKIRGHWRVVFDYRILTVAEARLRWSEGTNPRNPAGQPKPLAMVNELVEKLLLLHPDEAADLDYIDMADEGLLFGQREKLLVESVAGGVVAIENFRRALRGEAPIVEVPRFKTII